MKKKMPFCLTVNDLYTYSLHFPDKKNDDSEKASFVNEDVREDGYDHRRTPLVVLFGGPGCAEKCLDKYRVIYSRMG